MSLRGGSHTVAGVSSLQGTVGVATGEDPDADLQPWRAFADGPVLRGLADAALRVAPLLRARTWHRILLGVHPTERAEWQAGVPGWTAQFLGRGRSTACRGA